MVIFCLMYCVKLVDYLVVIIEIKIIILIIIIIEMFILLFFRVLLLDGKIDYKFNILKIFIVSYIIFFKYDKVVIIC